MQPNRKCTACEGSGEIFVKGLYNVIKRKCICTLLKKEEIEDVLSSNYLRNICFNLETGPEAGILLLSYLFDKEPNFYAIDELEISLKAGYYCDSLSVMMDKGEIERKEDFMGSGNIATGKKENETGSIYDENELTNMGTEDSKDSEESINEGCGIEIHYNDHCINCNSVRRKMIKVGTLFFCTKCFKAVFKKDNPLIEEKATLRAWLNYSQDLLLGMQDPIKPNTRIRNERNS